MHTRKTFFSMRTVKHWSRLPQVRVLPLSLTENSIAKILLDKSLSYQEVEITCRPESGDCTASQLQHL